MQRRTEVISNAGNATPRAVVMSAPQSAAELKEQGHNQIVCTSCYMQQRNNGQAVCVQNCKRNGTLFTPAR